MKLSYSKKIDTWAALTVFSLVLFGVVMIYSASVIVGYSLFNDDKHFFIRQIIWALGGFVGMVITANIDYRLWKKWASLMLGATFILLISVFIFSKGEINGAHRWINLAGQSFQPSELAKLTFILYLSAWLVERQNKLDSVYETFLPYLGVLAVISFLMLRQPDLGTLTIILVSAVSIYLVAGLTWKQMVLGVVLVGLSLGLVTSSSSYMRDRVRTFLNPGNDTQGISYHVNNIAIAIGSGGVTGLGFGESKQKLRYLPEPQTDSIFAIITEELGFIWSEMLILAYVFLLSRGYRIAMQAPDMFGRLVAVGITTWFGFQAFINLGSMLHIVPLVGVPLPFVSYGGTNLVISLLAVGILLNISRFAETDTEPTKKKGPRKTGRNYAYTS